MKRDFDNLVNDDGWKAMPEFAAYLKAIECVPNLGEKRYVDKSFFADAPSCFLARMLPFSTSTFQLLREQMKSSFTWLEVIHILHVCCCNG